jgi:hypothetical protein
MITSHTNLTNICEDIHGHLRNLYALAIVPYH